MTQEAEQTEQPQPEQAEQRKEPPRLDRPVFEPFDLGEFAEEYRGQTVRLLRNPSRAFWREYQLAPGSDTWRYIGAAMELPDDLDTVSAALDNIPRDAIRWLFLGVLDQESGELIPPYIMTLWDEWEAGRVKAFAARSRDSSKRGTKPTPTPKQDDNQSQMESTSNSE